MKVPEARPKTRPSSEGLGYLQAAEVDYSPITRGLAVLAQGAANWEERNRVEKEQSRRFKALNQFSDFQIKVGERLSHTKQTSPADTDNFDETWEGMYNNLENEFISTLEPDMQEEFRVRAQDIRRSTITDARNFTLVQRREHSNARIDDQFNKSSLRVEQDPNSLQEQEKLMYEFIDRAPGLTMIEREARKRAVARDLQGLKYRWEVKNGRTERPVPRDDRAPSAQKLSGRAGAIKAAADDLGIDPVALATVISYETGGTFSPSVRGGKNNKYIGLIQFGEAEQRQYGASQDQSFEEQMQAVVRYLKDRGLKPGMGLVDLYSTINAGAPGLYNRSDRPGYTVARHADEMAKSAHAKKAAALMGGELDIDGIENDPQYAALPLEDRFALRRQAEAERNAEIAEAARAQKEQEDIARNELFNGLAEGMYGKKEYDEAVMGGLLDDYDQRNKARTIMKERENENKYAREGAEKIGTMGRGGNAYFDPADAEDDKRMNAVIGEDGLAKIAAGDGAYVDNYLIPTIRQTHVVASNVAGALNAMVRSRDPKKALWALDIWSRIQDQDEAAFDQRTDEKLARDVDFWRAKRKYYDQEELLKQINGGNTQEERQARAVIREDGEKLIKEGKVAATDYIEHHDPYFSRAPQLINVPWAAIELGKDYNAVFVEEYVRYGNIPEAKEATNKALDRIWGVTEVGGIKTLMKYPPEKAMYRSVNGDYGYIERQVRNEFNLPADHQFQLLSDKVTEQELALWKTGRGTNPPSYQVVTRGPDGAWRTTSAPDGKPARIYFQITPEEAAAEERTFELNKANFDYQEFMNDVYIPRQQMMMELGEGVDAELEAKRKELEERLSVVKEQAGISPETPMLPHPVFRRDLRPDPRFQAETPGLQPPSTYEGYE